MLVSRERLPTTPAPAVEAKRGLLGILTSGESLPPPGPPGPPRRPSLLAVLVAREHLPASPPPPPRRPGLWRWLTERERLADSRGDK